MGPQDVIYAGKETTRDGVGAIATRGREVDRGGSTSRGRGEQLGLWQGSDADFVLDNFAFSYVQSFEPS